MMVPDIAAEGGRSSKRKRATEMALGLGIIGVAALSFLYAALEKREHLGDFGVFWGVASTAWPSRHFDGPSPRMLGVYFVSIGLGLLMMLTGALVVGLVSGPVFLGLSLCLAGLGHATDVQRPAHAAITTRRMLLSLGAIAALVVWLLLALSAAR